MVKNFLGTKLKGKTSRAIGAAREKPRDTAAKSEIEGLGPALPENAGTPEIASGARDTVPVPGDHVNQVVKGTA